MMKIQANTKQVLLRDSKGKFVGAGSSRVKSAQLDSSFIKNVSILGSTVDIVMARYPNTIYTYKPTTEGMKAVRNALKDHESVGKVYNKYLKGNEVKRTIYK